MAHHLVMAAGVAFLSSELDRTREICERGEQLCAEECRGVTWERTNFQWLRAMTLALLGELSFLREYLNAQFAEARERQDVWKLMNLRLGFISLAWLAEDRPDAARAEALNAIRVSENRGLFRYLGCFSLAQVELFEKRPAVALEVLEAALPALRKSLILRMQDARVNLNDLRARCALANAASANDSDSFERSLRLARKCVRRIQREDAPNAEATVERLSGCLAAMVGRVDEAARRLRLSAELHERHQMHLYSRAALLQSAKLEGAACESDRGAAATWLLERGALSPGRLADLIAPLPTWVENGGFSRGY